MDVSVRELIREAKNAVNARFDMLEHIVTHTATATVTKVVPSNDSKLYELINQQEEKINNLTSTLYRFNDLVDNIQKKIESMEKQGAPILSLMSGSVEKMPEIHIEFTDKPELNARSHYDTDKEDTHIERTFKVDVHKEEVVEEEEVMEEEEEVAEEEGGIELEEFEYKGMTLYRDGENKVYRMDEDGSLSDPLGIWDEAKQRIRKV